MKLKIYQINQGRDAEGAKFMNSDWLTRHTSSPAIDPSIYDEVFSGEVDCKNLEEVYTRFNTEGHPLHRGHSLSVSDVVVTDAGAFFCDSFGFLEIGFDESQTHKPDNLLKIVYVEPGQTPFVSEVGSGLKPMQRAVGGLIEPLYMGDGTVLVCNDEGKLKNMPGNRRLGDSIKLALRPAVELSHLTQEEQAVLLEIMGRLAVVPTLEQSQRLKKYSQDGQLTDAVMDAVLSDKKPAAVQVTLKKERLKQYFPQSYTQQQMEDVIFSLLEAWKSQQEGVGAGDQNE